MIKPYDYVRLAMRILPMDDVHTNIVASVTVRVVECIIYKIENKQCLLTDFTVGLNELHRVLSINQYINKTCEGFITDIMESTYTYVEVEHGSMSDDAIELYSDILWNGLISKQYMIPISPEQSNVLNLCRVDLERRLEIYKAISALGLDAVIADLKAHQVSNMETIQNKALFCTMYEPKT